MRLTLPQRALAEQMSRVIAIVCVISLPLALLYARALAEILIGVTDALFLFHLWVTRDLLSWRRPFALLVRRPVASRAFAYAALAWWAWQIVCSAFGTGGLLLSLVLFRLPLFALALGHWVLTGARGGSARRALWWAIALAAGWIVIECWHQDLLGHNIFGAERWGDGALTGPFVKPRAGPELILILFAVVLPASARLLALSHRATRASGIALVAVGAATIVLIGQRMPSALLVLGLVLSGLLLPRLRVATALAALIGVAVLAASPFVAPAMYAKLVVHTHEQLTDFAGNAYGQIWLRALVIARQHPWMGLGFDAFRRGCADPAAVQGVPWLGVTLAQARAATEACNIHPHNYYLEAADNGGVPLLLLFIAMVVVAGVALGRGTLTPLRAGLLVGFVLAFWPLASTSAFTSMPNAGWIFLLIGLGFAAREA